MSYDDSDSSMADVRSDESEGDFIMSDDDEAMPAAKTKSKASKTKTAAKTTTNKNKSSKTVLTASKAMNQSTTAASSSTGLVKPSTSKTKTVEEMYQKKTQLEHILLRPDTYSK
jgi:hypothetical protein